MKNTIKIAAFFILMLMILLVIPSASHAAISVNDEESLMSAISSADSGETIVLENNITVTQPIVIAKELTINGNGYTITGSSDWTSTSGNQTMFTAQFSNAKLTLKNINLQNGPKYGVQSYDGATVILDNVSITGFKYGGVLANGGEVEVRDLHLGYNGTGSNNGIEIDKGSAATNNPTLTMNGVLTSDSKENVIYVADNGYLTEFTVNNTSSTTNKVSVTPDKVVLTDANDNVVAESSLPEKVTVNADTQKAIISLVANGKTNKIAVDLGKTITADLLKSHIELEKNTVIDGFFTDEKYTDQFNFDDPINDDTTIYAKVSKVETENNEQENVINNGEKDETPKTGVQNYVGLATLAIVFSMSAILYMKKKNIKE